MPLADPNDFLAATKLANGNNYGSVHCASNGSGHGQPKDTFSATSSAAPAARAETSSVQPSAAAATREQTNGAPQSNGSSGQHSHDSFLEASWTTPPSQGFRRQPHRAGSSSAATPTAATAAAGTGNGGEQMSVLSQVFALEQLFVREISALKVRVEQMAVALSSLPEHDRAATHPAETTLARSWTPLGVRTMPPYKPTALAEQPLSVSQMSALPATFVKAFFGGAEHSPGLFYNRDMKSSRAAAAGLKLKSKTYYVLDAAVEPFLPREPGKHGAKLSVVFNDFEYGESEGRYDAVPLFVALPGHNRGEGEREGERGADMQLTYFGHYSQSRWSDKLDYDRGQEVIPLNVKKVWAEWLADKNRPEWVEHALMEHFWPKPAYAGEMPRDDTDGTTATAENGEGAKDDVAGDVKDYIEELKDWERDAKLKVGLLKKENVLEAFFKEDAAAEPGLRFWWEYLQCVHFDRNFHHVLATEAKNSAGSSNN